MGFESMGSESTWTVLSVCTSVLLQVVESCFLEARLRSKWASRQRYNLVDTEYRENVGDKRIPLPISAHPFGADVKS